MIWRSGRFKSLGVCPSNRKIGKFGGRKTIAELPIVDPGASCEVDFFQATLLGQAPRDVRAFVKTLPRSIGNDEDVRQLVRASGSVGANYIEANESLNKKDFVMRIKISRKEAKESRYWLRLLDTGGVEVLEKQRAALIQEATELMNIFGAILWNSK